MYINTWVEPKVTKSVTSEDKPKKKATSAGGPLVKSVSFFLSFFILFYFILLTCTKKSKESKVQKE